MTLLYQYIDILNVANLSSNTNWDFVANRKNLNTHRVIVIEYICSPNISFSYLKVDIVTQVSPPSFY